MGCCENLIGSKVDKIVISIIVATYNAGKTIDKCLSSIGLQKDARIELIVVDGDSTDCTMEKVRSSQFVDIYVSEKDHGIYDAWNKGILLSHGEYIMFVGSDDEILPKVLIDYADFVVKLEKGIDIVTAKSDFVDLKGNLIKKIGKPYVWNEYKKNMEIAHGTTLHHKSLFDRIGYYDTQYKICADYELLMRDGGNLKAAFFDKTIMTFKVGGASFSYKCQIETFFIRKKYHSVSLWENLYLAFRRCVGITLKKIRYATDE